MKIIARLENTGKDITIPIWLTGRAEFAAPVDGFSAIRFVEVVLNIGQVTTDPTLPDTFWVSPEDFRENNGEHLPANFWQRTKLLDINREEG